MNNIPIDLSERARSLVDQHASSAATFGRTEFEHVGASFDAKKERLSTQVARINDTYGGLRLDVAGGPVWGSMELGSGPHAKPSRSREGMRVIRAARLDELPCAIVVTESGEIGAYWTDECHILFDSIENLIEDCAMWNERRGWHYAAVLDGGLSRVLDAIGGLACDGVASGGHVAWWVTDGISVAAHPYLNPARGRNRQVAIMVRDHGSMENVRDRIRDAGINVPPGMYEALGRVG
jgi:hypothetical protein